MRWENQRTLSSLNLQSFSPRHSAAKLKNYRGGEDSKDMKRSSPIFLVNQQHIGNYGIFVPTNCWFLYYRQITGLMIICLEQL